MTQLDRLKEKAKTLELKDPKGAVEAWLEVLKLQESEGDANPDLALYNRIGDLYLKLRAPSEAADYYDRAVDKYAELGFHNNAIAMCNKVLRNAPARQGTYLKLARLYASKGFLAEAKQNFVEYAERMQKAGKIDQAFAALKSVTDLSPESEGLRHMLEEHLKMYGEVQKRPSVAKAPGPGAEPAVDVTKSGKRKTSSLVFLDLDEPAKPKDPARASASTPAPPRVAPKAAPAPTPPPPPAAPPKAVVEEEDDDAVDESGLEIERTSLGSDATPKPGSLLEGFETTAADLGDASAAKNVPSIRDDPTVEDVEPAAGFEPTISSDVGADDLNLITDDLSIGEPVAPPPAPAKPAMKPAAGPPPKPASAPKAPPPPPKAPPEPPRRRTQVEVPPLELEPDFASTTHAGHHVDDQPLAIEEPAGDWVETDDDAMPVPSSGFIELGVEGIVNQEKGALMFSGIEDIPAAPSIEALEERVADNPDDPELHQALGEALIEAGQRDRGIEELDIATNGFETAGNLQQARDLVDEILRLDPNSVRHRQKCVEFAFKAGDKPRLIDAYLELADTLLRSDLAEKARSVYQRVAEHDPGNPRVKAALAMLAPAAAAPAPAPAPKGKEGRVAAKDAKMTVRGSTADTGDFIDLGSLIMDEDHSDRDTRMKVEDEEPTGDEEKDFQEMLARFKQGIDENIDEADFQSHYDLGVAFKEMGLLDEAIAEFQRALRAPEGKLRTSEALGVCFFEKGAFAVTESILRRGLDLPAAGDQERLGILYWLGRALEEQGKGKEARELYGRVFAVDIRFRDVGDRVKALAKAR